MDRCDTQPDALPATGAGRVQESGNFRDAADGRRVERRQGDRRRRPTRPWRDWLTPLRRSTGRRSSDRDGYVDRYTTQDMALLLAIFVLNVVDAIMTLLWLHRGGREANPVMAFVLDFGPTAFIAQKCIVVAFWLVLLLVHKNFRFAKLGLYGLLVVYSVLFVIHFSIVALGIDPPRLDEATASVPVLSRTGVQPTGE